jgi:thiol-disulfide isomerase/thioredoxin
MFAGHRNLEARETSADGLLTVPQDGIFYGDQDTESKPIIAWTGDRTMIGLAELPRPCPATPLEVKLAPACRLEVKTTSKGLEQLGSRLSWSNVYIMWGRTRPMNSSSSTGEQVFILPPGEYQINAYGTDTDTLYPPLKIEPGERTRTVTLDLPASRLAELRGKPAPALTQIKGWVNGGPVTLADLKGKIVLLDFWGYWCGPCCRAMPELVALHEKYKDKGLVIIAVHDDSATDVAEMLAKLEKPKASFWHGKDLPFLIALDGGGQTEVPGHAWKARGATTAAYGITLFPTQVLIDKDGNVVGWPRRNQVEEMLRSLVEK